MKRSYLFLGLATVLTLTACGTAKSIDDIDGQFWQRVSSSEALYMRGPKAQQMLNRDISRCVTELRELEKLGAVKNAIPTDMAGNVLTEQELALADWDSPERDKHLYAEHSDYQDFESCMMNKGWERVEYVPYRVADDGRANYLAAHADYAGTEQRKSKKKMTSQTHGDYSNLNPFSVQGSDTVTLND